MWRGMVQDISQGTRECLSAGPVAGYIGFDPTADSLGVGNLVQVMMLTHFQRAGHRPVVLVGGATGLVGDPSGRSQERPVLTEATVAENVAAQRAQLERFLDFSGAQAATIVNNRDWYEHLNVLSFLREVGKHISVNSMLAKESVKRRITGEGHEGMSFAEFTYQLIQGYDFYWLWKHRGVKLQMGGSDQWGNIVAGTELIRRKDGGDAFALTTPLLTKADGTKFGKTEKGNLWLDARKTSPYEFYQFWLQASDADVDRYLRVFSVRPRSELEALLAAHNLAPERREAQRSLAQEITARVHGDAGVRRAESASAILFGDGTLAELAALPEGEFAEVFLGAGVPRAEVSRAALAQGMAAVELFADYAKLAPSRSQATQLLKAQALSINKSRLVDGKAKIDASSLIGQRYLLLQRGKRDYCLIEAV